MSLRVEKDDKLLQDMMQQMLKNQSVMAASLRGLQQDVQMLKEQNEEKPVEYMQQLPDELPSTEWWWSFGIYAKAPGRIAVNGMMVIVSFRKI